MIFDQGRTKTGNEETNDEFIVLKKIPFYSLEIRGLKR
jgi:hypothetical protein